MQLKDSGSRGIITVKLPAPQKFKVSFHISKSAGPRTMKLGTIDFEPKQSALMGQGPHDDHDRYVTGFMNVHIVFLFLQNYWTQDNET